MYCSAWIWSVARIFSVFSTSGPKFPVTIVPTPGLAEVLQPVLPGPRGELVEVERVVDLFQVLVVQVVVGLVAEGFEFAA